MILIFHFYSRPKFNPVAQLSREREKWSLDARVFAINID